MNLIVIDPSLEPECLAVAKRNKLKYEGLSSECLEETRTILNLSQKGLCAYCERTAQIVFIEHYFPRKSGLQYEVDFQNFLGVCSGKIYSNKHQSTFTSICGNYKENSILKINPKIQEHIEKLSYDSEAKIFSSEQTHNNDLNEVLNLNAQELVSGRIKEFGRTMTLIDRIAKKNNQGQKNSYEKRIKVLEKLKIEFLGYHLFRLKKLEEKEANES